VRDHPQGMRMMMASGTEQSSERKNTQLIGSSSGGMPSGRKDSARGGAGGKEQVSG